MATTTATTTATTAATTMPSPTPPARTPPREDTVLSCLLQRWAADTPDQVFAVFDDGHEWTYAQTLAEVQRTALGLQRLGVCQGDHVLAWLPNGADCLRTWFAINHLGAVYVSINTAYRGGLLADVVHNSGARLVITIATLAERLATVNLAALQQLVVMDQGNTAVPGPRVRGLTMPGLTMPGLKLHGRQALAAEGELQPLARAIEPWDTQSIYFTSGTTGPSKGVLSSCAHLMVMSRHTVARRDGTMLLTAQDRYLLNLPLFHVGGLVVPLAMLAVGGSIVVQQGFDTAGFWPTVQRNGITCTILLGVMAAYLVKQAPLPGETPGARHTTLRHVVGIPMTEEVLAFRRRFGVDVTTLFNMSEVSCPLISDLNPTQLGGCGRPRDGMQVRIVDAHDNEVAPGTVGELIVRGDAPWTLNHGYNADAEATARAWRNGWFHTGDAFRQGADGEFFFVDRIKDAIRRRGENISSFEVESAVMLHPAVREAAALAVPSADSEDEVLVAVALVDGHTLDPAELIDFLRPRPAHFMIPRYLRVLPELPKTPTAKVQKVALRAEGVTADTWDRERAGIRISRDRF